jgi:hypothetical protein
MASTFSAVEYGRLHYRIIERPKLIALKDSFGHNEKNHVYFRWYEISIRMMDRKHALSKKTYNS